MRAASDHPEYTISPPGKPRSVAPRREARGRGGWPERHVRLSASRTLEWRPTHSASCPDERGQKSPLTAPRAYCNLGAGQRGRPAPGFVSESDPRKSQGFKDRGKDDRVPPSFQGSGRLMSQRHILILHPSPAEVDRLSRLAAMFGPVTAATGAADLASRLAGASVAAAVIEAGLVRYADVRDVLGPSAAVILTGPDEAALRQAAEEWPPSFYVDPFVTGAGAPRDRFLLRALERAVEHARLKAEAEDLRRSLAQQETEGPGRLRGDPGDQGPHQRQLPLRDREADRHRDQVRLVPEGAPAGRGDPPQDLRLRRRQQPPRPRPRHPRHRPGLERHGLHHRDERGPRALPQAARLGQRLPLPRRVLQVHRPAGTPRTSRPPSPATARGSTRPTWPSTAA